MYEIVSVVEQAERVDDHFRAADPAVVLHDDVVEVVLVVILHIGAVLAVARNGDVRGEGREVRRDLLAVVGAGRDGVLGGVNGGGHATILTGKSGQVNPTGKSVQILPRFQITQPTGLGKK